MARYIDADALIKRIYPIGIGDGMYVINAKAVKFAIDTQPTADVLEVVRCKDCKWWHTNGCAFRNDCAKGLPCDDDFCSHGERKTTDERED